MRDSGSQFRREIDDEGDGRMLPREPFHRTAVFAGVLGIGFVILLGTVIKLRGNGPLLMDSWWHDLMLAWRTDFGLMVARGFAYIGGVTPMIIIGVFIVVAFLLLRRPRSALIAGVAMLTTDALTGILKVTFARPRPDDSLADVALTSFPSGHTSAAAAAAVILALLLHRRIVWVLAACWMVAMAWSRTYLEAHWLTDVLGGAVLGTSVALLIWRVVSALTPKGRSAFSPSLH